MGRSLFGLKLYCANSKSDGLRSIKVPGQLCIKPRALEYISDTRCHYISGCQAEYIPSAKPQAKVATISIEWFTTSENCSKVSRIMKGLWLFQTRVDEKYQCVTNRNKLDVGKEYSLLYSQCQNCWAVRILSVSSGTLCGAKAVICLRTSGAIQFVEGHPVHDAKILLCQI